MKNQTKNVRQGDCMFKHINLIPEKAKKIASRIVAQGEHSNHSHIITGDAEVYELDGKFFIDATDASVEHLLESSWLLGNKEWTKEHLPIKLEPGLYEMLPQQQYNPYEKARERVRD